VSTAGLDALIRRQLCIAAQADPHHCSDCGRYLWFWYYGFPLPLCAACIDRQRRRYLCPACALPLDRRGPFDGTEPSSGVPGGHVGFGETFLCDRGHWYTLIQGALVPAERILTVCDL
jgi:hypothetical protein